MKMEAYQKAKRIIDDKHIVISIKSTVHECKGTLSDGTYNRLVENLDDVIEELDKRFKDL